MQKYKVQTPYGDFVSCNLKEKPNVCIVYGFEENERGESGASIFKYSSWSSKELNDQNMPYINKLSRNKHTKTGIAYGANWVEFYTDIEEV